MLAIIDYGMGNIRSVGNALDYLAVPYTITSDPAVISTSERIIIPGVGSFRQAMENLNSRGLTKAIRAAADRGTPILGICLGMQLLATHGEEDGDSEGIGLIPGRVTRLDAHGERIPHIGFNTAVPTKPSTLFSTDVGADYYFVHSYHFVCADEDDVSARTEYGTPFTAAVERGAVFGTQFHPEKSQSNGLRVLKRFCEVPVC